MVGLTEMRNLRSVHDKPAFFSSANPRALVAAGSTWKSIVPGNSDNKKDAYPRGSGGSGPEDTTISCRLELTSAYS